jgi:hypothetical protein
MTNSFATARWKKGVTAGALVAAGVGIGAAVASTTAADAATPTPSATASPNSGSSGSGVDESKSQRSDEHLLTGDSATKVRDAALGKYPGATIQRVETDSDGVYEAHIVTTAGDHVIVQVGKDFTVTGTQTGGGGRGHHDKDADDSGSGTSG